MTTNGAAGRAAGQGAGWDPDRELMRARRIRQIEWAAVPLYTFGFLAFVPFLYIAIARRRWWAWAVFSVYLAADIALMVLVPHPDAVTSWLFTVLIVGGTVHALIELRPGSALAASRDVYPASGADRALRVLTWHGTEMVLGRDAAGSPLLAGDPDVSPRHAILRRTRHGTCVVEDVGSAAGTFVNGMPINGPARLYSGDELRLGASRLRVQGDPFPAAVMSVDDVPRQADAAGHVPGALRIDHAELRMQLPVFGAVGGTARPGWLVMTETGEIRFYDKLPADMTRAPAFLARSPEEFVRKIGKIQVWARFGPKKCLVWFDGERAPERLAATIEEQADQWGDMVGTAGDNMRDAVPDAGVVATGGDAVALAAKTLQLVRMARNSKRRAAARDAWYPVLLGRQPWTMINAARVLTLEIPWLTGHPAGSRRAAPWTTGEVLNDVAQAGQGAAAVAAAVCDWATAHPRLTITGGTGASYPFLTVHADFGASRRIGLLSLHGGPAVLEVRVGQMCSVPPYDGDAARVRFTAGLHALGIMGLKDVPLGKKPSIPLDDLADGRAERLLHLLDRWIDDVQAPPAPCVAELPGKVQAVDRSSDPGPVPVLRQAVPGS
jgi:FHA domain